MKFLLVISLVLAVAFTQEKCKPLFGEIPSRYTAFILGDYDLEGSDNEGRVAVGGNARIERSGVGFGLTGDCKEPGNGPKTLVVNGALHYTEGRVWHGDIVYGENSVVAQDKVSVEAGCEKREKVDAIDFEKWATFLKDLTAEIAAKTANGVVERQEYDTNNLILTFNGDGSSDCQVFDVDVDDLKKAKYMELNVHDEVKSIYINVVGTNAGIGLNGGVSFREFEKFNSKIVWNFPTALEVHLTSVGVQGSILAPYAHFPNPTGEMYGQLFGASWSGPLQQHVVYHDGCKKKTCDCCRYCPTGAPIFGN
jgi:choice-of-anchor A domain-containing protein